MKKYTDEQRKLIEQNDNVVKCGVTGVTFKREFKIKALDLYKEGKTATQIFRESGFDLQIVGKNFAKNNLKLWKTIVRKKGEQALLKPKIGGGRPRKIQRGDQEELKYLRAQIEYLKAENSFLAKLRAKKKAE